MFRFTIRDVLWLMVVVALAMGWWLENRHLRASNAELEQHNAAYNRELLELDKVLRKRGISWDNRKNGTVYLFDAADPDSMQASDPFANPFAP